MAVSARRRSSTPKRFLGFALVAVLVWCAYTVGSSGELRVPFTDLSVAVGEQTAEAGPPAGTVPVPRTTRVVGAFQKLTREDLWDAEEGKIAVFHLPIETVEEQGIITDFSELRGRVLAREKAPGFVFTERDFLEEGTRPGVVAGIPAGKRAMRIEVDQVVGLVGLNPGDRFDILSTMPVGPDSNKQVDPIAGPFAEQLQLSAIYSGAYNQAIVRVVVQSGEVVTPVETRTIPVYTSSLTQGGVTRTRPVQEVVLAVEPEEVAPLAQALAIDAKLICIPRSGRPGDPLDSDTPGSEPKVPMPLWGGGMQGAQGDGSLVLIETFVGSEREFRPVPRSTGN